MFDAPGEGATFFFTVNLPTDIEDHGARIPQGLAGKKAPVVGDNPVGQQIYQPALEWVGVEAVIAELGAAALVQRIWPQRRGV